MESDQDIHYYLTESYFEQLKNGKKNASIQSTKEDKDQESIQSSTTSDPGYQWESYKLTIGHHKRESRGQPLPSR